MNSVSHDGGGTERALRPREWLNAMTAARVHHREHDPTNAYTVATPSFPAVNGNDRPDTLRRMPRASGAPSERTRVKRVHELAAYDRETIDAILDAALICHLGFEREGQPYVIPTLHARIGETLYVHGSSASRTVRALGEGIPACVTVTLLDGIVLARSIFEHSVNYRSVVVLGTATAVVGADEKRAVLEAFTEKLLPGRWADARQPTAKELKATGVLALPLNETSAKVRTGAPDDGDSPDAELDIWAGHLPLVLHALAPVAAPELRPGIPVPPYASRYHRDGLTD